LQLLVSELGRGYGIHEVARHNPPAEPDDGGEGRERVSCRLLTDVELVK
jgi:hypothetical protein